MSSKVWLGVFVELALSIDGLRFGYDKKKLLFNDFSLRLKKGELVSVVGPSGVGKSTLFDLITGHLKPIGGTLKAAKIAQVFQDPYSSFSHSYTIYEQLQEVAIGEIDFAFLQNSFNLREELVYKRPFELSGGQLQRFSIYRALLMKPELILADEPTSALDNITQLQIMKLLLTCLQSAAILLITHDAALANWCSDRVVEI